MDQTEELETKYATLMTLVARLLDSGSDEIQWFVIAGEKRYDPGLITVLTRDFMSLREFYKKETGELLGEIKEK